MFQGAELLLFYGPFILIWKKIIDEFQASGLQVKLIMFDLWAIDVVMPKMHSVLLVRTYYVIALREIEKSV